MSLVSMKMLLQNALKQKYAIPAFNFDNFDVLMSILDGAEFAQSPVILQITEPALMYLGIDNVVSVVRNEAIKRNLLIALHLDHADNFEIIKKCIESGFTSVMIDYSSLEYDENVDMTKKVVLFAKKHDITVESELGYVSSANDRNQKYTDLAMVKDFVTSTGIDALGVSIGNKHGGRERSNTLDVDLLNKIHNQVSVPLVLHGSSGVSYNSIKKVIKLGIAKVNVETALRLEFRKNLEYYIKTYSDEIKPRNIMGYVKKSVSEKVTAIYAITESANKLKEINNNESN